MGRMAEAGKGDWEGVKRRYWTLDSKSAMAIRALRFLPFSMSPRGRTLISCSRIPPASLYLLGLSVLQPFDATAPD